MTLERLLRELRLNPESLRNVTAQHEKPPQPACYAPYPPELDWRPRLALQVRGIRLPYVY